MSFFSQLVTFRQIFEQSMKCVSEFLAQESNFLYVPLLWLEFNRILYCVRTPKLQEKVVRLIQPVEREIASSFFLFESSPEASRRLTELLVRVMKHHMGADPSSLVESLLVSKNILKLLVNKVSEVPEVSALLGQLAGSVEDEALRRMLLDGFLEFIVSNRDSLEILLPILTTLINSELHKIQTA